VIHEQFITVTAKRREIRTVRINDSAKRGLNGGETTIEIKSAPIPMTAKDSFASCSQLLAAGAGQQANRATPATIWSLVDGPR
jgi:hypothetical protein